MRSSGGDGCAGLLAVFVVFLPIIILGWVVWKVLEWVADHPKEVAAFLKAIVQLVLVLLWAPQLIAAWALMVLARDIPVYLWPESWGAKEERFAIIVWGVFVPMFAIIAWLALTLNLQGRARPENVLLSLVSTGVLVATYYWLYVKKTPQRHGTTHFRWPRFVAAQELLLFDLQIGFVERRTQFRLWQHSLWSQPKALLPDPEQGEER